MKKLLKLLLIISLSCMMVSIFGGAEITCEVDMTSDDHYCRYGFISVGLEKTNSSHELLDTYKSWAVSSNTPKVVNYHMLDNYTIPQDVQITIGENVYVGICLFKSNLTYTESQIVLPQSGKGGFFVYDCTMHGCFNESEPALNVSRAYLDFMIATNRAVNGANAITSIPAGYYSVSEDVDMRSYLESNDCVFENPSETVMCFNNRNSAICAADNAKLNSLGIKTHVYCSEKDKKAHECAFVPENAVAVDQALFDIAVKDALFTEGTLFAYLTESVTWDKKLELPETASLIICKNGYDFDLEYGQGVFVIDCTPHSCAMGGFEQAILIDESLVELMALGGEVVFTDGFYALKENLDLSLYNVTVDPNASSIILCLNGYQISLGNGVDLSMAGVTVIDCTKQEGAHLCDKAHPEATAVVVSAEELLSLFDDNGEFLGREMSVALSLSSDVMLSRPLVIPTGTDLTLCLNGHTILSSKTIDSKDLLEVPHNYNAMFTVEYGASLKIVDCNEESKGYILADTSNSYSMSEESESTSESEKDAEGFSVPVLNLGATVIDGASLYGLYGLINHGDLTVKDGGMHAVGAGLLQDIADEDEYPLHTGSITSKIENSDISGYLVGAVVNSGDTQLENTTVSAMMFGLITGITLSGETSQAATVSVKDVSIVMSNIVSDFHEKIGVSEDKISSPNVESVIGIMLSNDLAVKGDLNIYVDPELIKPFENSSGNIVTPTVVEAALSQGVIFKIEEGVEITDTITVMPSGAEQIVASVNNPAFLPPEGFVSCTNAQGELVFLSADNAGFMDSALVADCRYSFDGSLKLVMVCDYDKNSTERYFLKEGHSSSVRVSIDGIEDMILNPEVGYSEDGYTYYYEMAIAPKDYQKAATVQFSDGNYWWGGAEKLSLEAILLIQIEECDGFLTGYGQMSEEEKQQNAELYEKCVAARDIALVTLNYCKASANQFGTADGYQPVDASLTIVNSSLSSIMDMVDAQLIESSKPTKVGNNVSGISFAGTSVFLESDFRLRFYFVATDLSGITVTCDGSPVELCKYEGVKNGYYFEISSVSAVDVFKAYEITVSKGESQFTVNYAVASYFYSQLKNSSINDNLKNVIKAAVVYALVYSSYAGEVA